MATAKNKPAAPHAIEQAEIKMIALSKLVPSPLNVRKTGGQSIEDLAASIADVGLIQNLSVVPVAGGKFEVCAGGRRLKALNSLRLAGKLDADHLVQCRVFNSREAVTVSLAENTLREAMHPADQFEAFQKLVDAGRPIEDVAAAFGVSPVTVERRMKLANVSPKILKAYRAGNLTLEAVMAFAATDNHKRQEQVHKAALAEGPWALTEANIRRRVTDGEVSAVNDPRAIFVGVAAYEAAGGQCRRDLFSDEGEVYLLDEPLLDSLVSEHLSYTATTVRKEGWQWVQVMPQIQWSVKNSFGTAPQTKRAPTPREATRLEELKAQVLQLDARLEELYSSDEDDANAEYIKLDDERDGLISKIDEIEEKMLTWSKEVMALSGAIVHLDTDGKPNVLRGLVYPEDKKAMVALMSGQSTEDGSDDEDADGNHAPAAASSIPVKLAQRLRDHMTLGLQAEVAKDSHLALAALVHSLALRVFNPYLIGSTVDIRGRAADVNVDLTGEEQSPAADYLGAVHSKWEFRMDRDLRLSWFLAQKDEVLLELLAYCVSRFANSDSGASELYQTANPHMDQIWSPTAEGYFSYLTKEQIEADLVDAGLLDAAREVRGMKKAEACKHAAKAMQAVSWLPPLMRQKTTAESDEG